MSFIKNIDNKFKMYDQIHESYFMYNNISHRYSLEQGNTTKTCMNLLQELRQTEYSFLNYYQENSKNNTIQYINKTLDINEQLEIINRCYTILSTWSFKDIKNNINGKKITNTFVLLYELHDRILFYYRIMNEKIIFKNNNINIININKHSYCVHYILNHFKTDTLPTMIFFDSHADLNPGGNTDIDYTSINNEDYHDVGVVNIPILLNYKKNNGVHWIVPDHHPYSYVRKLMTITQDNNIVPFDDNTEYIKKNEYNGKILHHLDFSPDMYDETNKINTYIQPINYTLTNIDYFSFFESITDDYILNIDLDYFISNGVVHGRSSIDKFFTKEWTDKHNDISTANIYDINMEPCVVSDRCIHGTNIDKELLSIRTKIDEFLIFINKIKSLGKTPKMIILCDSARSHISLFDNDNYDTIENNFLPKRYAFWLRNTLFNHIKILLGEEIKIL